MDRCIVLGNPVARRRLPFIRARVAAAKGQDMESGPLECPPEGFEAGA